MKLNIIILENCWASQNNVFYSVCYRVFAFIYNYWIPLLPMCLQCDSVQYGDDFMFGSFMSDAGDAAHEHGPDALAEGP